ncbi:MAG: LemA family protein, partial [Bacteroidales bacterium]|nr:LemA family protein [Bacteroidales bacterium]
MEWWHILLIIIILLVFWFVATYNSLISLRNKVKNQWSQIDVQLKRRFDLIPNLVETVKGYTKHESETLEKVIQARNTYLSAKTPEAQMEASGELSKVMSKLFALSESYPDLKANTNFMDMQNSLKDTEDKISYARQFYNDIVMKYNTKIESVP